MPHLRLCTLLFITLLVAPVQAQNELAHSYIAFVATPDQNDDILVIDSDGNNLHNLTHNPARDWHPDWSPDGQQIIFTSDRDGSADIFTMNANGGDVLNLTETPEIQETAPAWAADGDRIVYLGQEPGDSYNLYLLNRATGQTQALTSDGVQKGTPAWSPDGTQIAFWRKNGDENNLIVLDVDSGQETIVVEGGLNNWPTFSPDGQTLAFYRVENEKALLYTVDLESGAVTPQSASAEQPVNDLQPTWSVSGRQWAFTSDREGGYQIYLQVAFGAYNPLGAFPRPLTNLEVPAHSPAWQPTPYTIDFSGNGAAALSLSMNVVTTMEDVTNEELGSGMVRMFAPENIQVDEVVRIRLELSTLEGSGGTSTAAPDIVFETAQQLYRYMGAELHGFDIDNFDIMPSPSRYIIHVDPAGENYWEWWLRPKGPEAVKANTLFVTLYLPEQQIDGAMIETELFSQPFTITVDAPQQPLAPVATPLQLSTTPVASPSLRVIPGGSDFFSIIVLNTLDVTGLEISTSDEEPIYLTEAFDVFELAGTTADESMCLHFVRYQTQPPLPLVCEGRDNYRREVNNGDIFWYSFNTNRLRDTIIRTPTESLGVCPAEQTDGCEF